MAPPRCIAARTRRAATRFGRAPAPVAIGNKPRSICASTGSVRGLVRKVQAVLPPEPAPEVIMVNHNNSPLFEAPASVNVRVQVAGREVQWTLRDRDEARLALRLEALLARYPLPQPAPQASRTAEGWCAVHQVQMKRNEKNGRQWFSHRLATGDYCKGGAQ
jgi:hypothetical protein